MKNLTQEFKKQIEERISEIEKHTSVEFVPVIALRSSDYYIYRLIAFLLVFSLSLTTFVFFEHSIRPEIEVLISLGLGLLCGGGLIWSPIFRLVMPKTLQLASVEREAFREFVIHEVFATVKRTGVMIFISELEKSVFILADKGVVKIIPESDWAQLGHKLAQDFSNACAGPTFLKALDGIVENLGNHFPADSQVNELSNEVRNHRH